MNNKSKQLFIATSDEETASRLRDFGYQELPKQGNRWMFVNDGKIHFSQSDEMKVSYTDILTFA